MEEKLKNPNIDSTDLKTRYQAKLKQAKEKQDDMVAYDKEQKRPLLKDSVT